jgi:hypothetical protein
MFPIHCSAPLTLPCSKLRQSLMQLRPELSQSGQNLDTGYVLHLIHIHIMRWHKCATYLVFHTFYSITWE